MNFYTLTTGLAVGFEVVGLVDGLRLGDFDGLDAGDPVG